MRYVRRVDLGRSRVRRRDRRLRASDVMMLVGLAPGARRAGADRDDAARHRTRRGIARCAPRVLARAPRARSRADQRRARRDRNDDARNQSMVCRR